MEVQKTIMKNLKKYIFILIYLSITGGHEMLKVLFVNTCTRISTFENIQVFCNFEYNQRINHLKLVKKINTCTCSSNNYIHEWFKQSKVCTQKILFV